ncbi:hypothetical protein DUI87_04729 [Hirundo rustica rustica]|uniref:SRCR domain-containing protein n=1 Tax=Hirundo rustica rustica TaxID=333673 RepID=A0A3M0L0A1_HIRRU|nr:hypothetical protein DUI87_04729 [Hirundo rustica rustica]
MYSGPEESDFKCSPNFIGCIGTNKCIHLSQLCNGVYDCSDGYDEGVHCRGIRDSFLQSRGWDLTPNACEALIFQWAGNNLELMDE